MGRSFCKYYLLFKLAVQSAVSVDIAVAAVMEAGGTAFVASSGGDMVRDLDRVGARHFKMPVHSKNPLRMWLNSRRLIKIIREFDVQIVHARSRAPAWSCRAACLKTGAHFITTFMGPIISIPA